MGCLAASLLVFGWLSLTNVQTPPFAQLMAMRRLALLGALVASIALCIIVLVFCTRQARALQICSLALVGLLLATGVWAWFPPGASDRATDRAALKVLSWNTNQDDVSAEDILHIVVNENPDVVVLPEYFYLLAKQSLSQLKSHYEFYSRDASASTLLVSRRLGPYTVEFGQAPPWAGFVAKPSKSSAPTIVVAHIQRPDLLNGTSWRRDLTWAAKACEQPNTLAIGDFNATRENLEGGTLGRCTDAAATLGVGGAGTWPTSLPPGLGAQIDHMFAGRGWKPTTFAVITDAPNGSDHRPIIATFRSSTS